jgi:hypothetical protein
MIPAHSNKELCNMLGATVLGKVFIPASLAMVAMFLLTSVLRLAGSVINPYVILYSHVIYWASIGVVIVLEIIMSAYISWMFGKKGCMILSVLPPVAFMVLSTGIPSYFKENKDSLTGAFEVTT